MAQTTLAATVDGARLGICARLERLRDAGADDEVWVGVRGGEDGGREDGGEVEERRRVGGVQCDVHRLLRQQVNLQQVLPHDVDAAVARIVSTIRVL